MATIRRLESGSYQAIVRKAGFPPNTKTFDTKRAAQEWATQIESDINAGRAHGPAHAHRLFDLTKEYRAGPMKKLRTVGDRERHLKFWEEALGNVRLADVKREKIAKVLRAYAATPVSRLLRKRGKLVPVDTERSSQTVRHTHMCLSALLDFAVRDLHWLAENPARLTRRAAAAAPRIRWLKPEQRDKLLEACRDSLNPDLYLVVLIALTSGARQAEIVNLKWSQIDWKQRVAWLTPEATKNQEPRAMPMVAEVITELKKRTRHLRIDFVFHSEVKRNQPRNIRQAWEVARKRAGLDDFRFHDLRHSAATELLRAGVDSRVVAAVLGHKSMAMMRRYAHVAPALAVEAAERAAGNAS